MARPSGCGAGLPMDPRPRHTSVRTSCWLAGLGRLQEPLEPDPAYHGEAAPSSAASLTSGFSRMISGPRVLPADDGDSLRVLFVTASPRPRRWISCVLGRICFTLVLLSLARTGPPEAPGTARVLLRRPQPSGLPLSGETRGVGSPVSWEYQGLAAQVGTEVG